MIDLSDTAKKIEDSAIRSGQNLWYWPYLKFHRRAHIIDPTTRTSFCKKVERLTDAQFVQAHEDEHNPFNVTDCAACKKAKRLKKK